MLFARTGVQFSPVPPICEFLRKTLLRTRNDKNYCEFLFIAEMITNFILVMNKKTHKLYIIIILKIFAYIWIYVVHLFRQLQERKTAQLYRRNKRARRPCQTDGAGWLIPYYRFPIFSSLYTTWNHCQHCGL